MVKARQSIRFEIKMKMSNEKFRVVERFNSLLESGIFINPKVDGKLMAKMIFINYASLDSTLNNEIGFSSNTIIDCYRLNYAHQLQSLGISFKYLHKYCGFGSRKALERALDSIVN